MKDGDKENGQPKEKSGAENKSASSSAPYPALSPDPEYVKGLARGGYNHAKA